MLFTLYNIAIHSKVQQKVLDEIHTVFGTEGKPGHTLHRLNDMHYLEMVIRESLRLYPSIPVIGRTTTSEVVISKLLT